jgi:hypothetical protein
MKVSPAPKSRMFTPETPDDDLAGKVKDSPNGNIQLFIICLFNFVRLYTSRFPGDDINGTDITA